MLQCHVRLQGRSQRLRPFNPNAVVCQWQRSGKGSQTQPVVTQEHPRAVATFQQEQQQLEGKQRAEQASNLNRNQTDCKDNMPQRVTRPQTNRARGLKGARDESEERRGEQEKRDGGARERSRCCSVLFVSRAVPSAFAPSSPMLLSASGKGAERGAKHSQW